MRYLWIVPPVLIILVAIVINLLSPAPPTVTAEQPFAVRTSGSDLELFIYNKWGESFTFEPKVGVCMGAQVFIGPQDMVAPLGTVTEFTIPADISGSGICAIELHGGTSVRTLIAEAPLTTD